MQSFTDKMEQGRDIAARDRARGLHTGKLAAGWERKRPKEHANDNCAWLLAWRAHWRAHWRATCAEIRNEFSAVARSDPHETWEF